MRPVFWLELGEHKGQGVGRTVLSFLLLPILWQVLLEMQARGAGLEEQPVYKPAVQIGLKSTGLKRVYTFRFAIKGFRRAHACSESGDSLLALLKLLGIISHAAQMWWKNESGDREQMQMHILFVRVAHSTRSCQAVPRREPGHLVLGFSVLVAADCCDMFSGWAGTRGRESGASTWCSHYNATAAFSVAKGSWRYNIGGARLGEQPVYKAAVQIGSRRV